MINKPPKHKAVRAAIQASKQVKSDAPYNAKATVTFSESGAVQVHVSGWISSDIDMLIRDHGFKIHPSGGLKGSDVTVYRNF